MAKVKSIIVNDKYIEDSKNYLENFIHSLNEDPFYAKSPNRKDHQISITIHKNDLLILEAIANRTFGSTFKRSEVIGTLVSCWVKDLFNHLPGNDKQLISKIVDKKITEDSKHHYLDKTWDWQVSQYDLAMSNDDFSLTSVEDSK